MRSLKRDERGFALVTALWAALILALLSSYLVGSGRNDTRIERTLRKQAEQRAIAQGVISLVELRLFNFSTSQLPLDGRKFRFQYGGVSAQVNLQDQAGLVDLNMATPEMLLQVLRVVGKLDSIAAKALADHILDWREAVIGQRLNGGKTSDYAEAGLAYGPRLGLFESVGELALVMGMTPAIYERIAPVLTVHSQKPGINLQVAPPEVLAVMPGLSADAIEQIIAQRAYGRSATSAELGSAATRVVAISVDVEDAHNDHAGLRTVIRITGERSNPAWVYVPAE